MKIKSQTEKAPILEAKKEKSKKKSKFTVLSGFRFGFGLYLAFLTGTLILTALTIMFWWVFDLFGISLF